MQGGIGVSVRLIIVNTTLRACLSPPRWKISYGKILKIQLSRPQASIFTRLKPPQLDLIRQNVTQVGINVVATSTGGFLHSPCVDPRPRYFYGARHSHDNFLTAAKFWNTCGTRLYCRSVRGAAPEKVKLPDRWKRHVVGLSGSSEWISSESGY